jgi:glycosyltransferase involved in cell wall biosynthesis
VNPKVSLICTVLNEGTAIERLLESIRHQTCPPDEVIFVDGGSADDTVAILERHAESCPVPIRVIVVPGANISQGRNVAIQAATNLIIAGTDAGVRLDPQWLAELARPFQHQPSAVAVAGFFVPDPHSVFELAMSATVLPRLEEIDPATFLPSSRSVAFLKSSWQKIGGYPEWLDFCEDLIFDFRLRDEVGQFSFAPGAVVYFRPRSSLKAFFKQYYRYARGDGKADLWRLRHAIRYLTYLMALPLLLGLGAWISPWWWLLGATLGGVGLFYTPYKRLLAAWPGLSPWQKLQAAAWVPVIRITGDVAKMLGYPAGWKWRLAHLSNRPELNWRNYKS